MAKRRKGVNLSQLVRDQLLKDPEASPKKVAEDLKSHGVTAALVSNIKYAMKNKGISTGTVKRGRPVGRPAAKQSANGHGGSGNYVQLLAAADLIKACGDVKSARAALEAAGEIAVKLGG